MNHPDDRSGQTVPTLKSIGIAGEAHAVGRIQRLEAEVKRLNGVISDATKSLAESAAREAAYATHHCESEGCAHEGEYTAKAALWADKYHRYQAALRRIAITEDADCALAKNPQAMTAIAREALK